MTESIINISIDEALSERVRGAVFLDVREDDEWSAGHVPGARHLRLSEIPDRYEELPRDKTIVCICHMGSRSARAAAFLNEQGFSTRNLAGGMMQWEAEQQIVEIPD